MFHWRLRNELGAEGAQTAHQDININEQAVLSHIGQKLRHRPAEHEDAEAAKDGEQAVGEHLLFAVALIEPKRMMALDMPIDTKGMSRLAYWLKIIRQAEIGDLGHRVGQERLNDERQQLGRKAADGKDDGIAGELRIFIGRRRSFRFPKDFLSYFNKSRRAFQSGISSATSAQKAGLWLGCKKWQYSCTTT